MTVYKKAFIFLLLMAGAVSGYAETDTPAFTITPAPERMQLGESTIVSMHLAAPDAYEYRWLTKYGSEDWTWSAPWVPSASFAFRPNQTGRWALHVDVRKKGASEPFMRKWLGEVEVADTLVKRVWYEPPVLMLFLGDEISFYVQKNPRLALDSLEFCLLDPSQPEGKNILQPWRPWPLAPFIAAHEGMTTLQVNVRKKQDPQDIEKYWLGEFHITRAKELRGKNVLLRNLLSDDFNKLGKESSLAFAYELWIAAHLVAWGCEEKGYDTQAEMLARFACVKKIVREPPALLRITTVDGEEYTYTTTTKSFSETGSAVTIALSALRYVPYAKILTEAKHMTETERMLLVLTYAIYEGYRYGVPSRSMHRLAFVEQVVSNCASNASLLAYILQVNGVKADVVTITQQKTHAAHAVVQAYPAGAAALLLDPTTGYVYRFDIRAINQKKIPQPIILPRIRELDFLDLRKFCSVPCAISITQGSDQEAMAGTAGTGEEIIYGSTQHTGER